MRHSVQRLGRCARRVDMLHWRSRVTIRATIASIWLFAALMSLSTLGFAQSGSRPGVIPSRSNADDSNSQDANARSREERAAPSGPRVLTPEELAPDSGEIGKNFPPAFDRSEEHTSELQSRGHLV